MLQQTQVERVVPFYKKFIKQFPTAKRLASVPLSSVLQAWQGLGYNRRAKMLHHAAQELSKIPKSSYRTYFVEGGMTVDELQKLPGVGPYTARAVAAFAYNTNVIFVETNIRTVIIHHFFSRRSAVEDTEVLEVLKKVFPKGRAREWYSALMDYGASLKKFGVKVNAKSKTYAKQAKFAGSLREARGAIVRAYTKGTKSRTRLIGALGSSRRKQMKRALEALVKEGLISENLL